MRHLQFYPGSAIACANWNFVSHTMSLVLNFWSFLTWIASRRESRKLPLTTCWFLTPSTVASDWQPTAAHVYFGDHELPRDTVPWVRCSGGTKQSSHIWASSFPLTGLKIWDWICHYGKGREHPDLHTKQTVPLYSKGKIALLFCFSRSIVVNKRTCIERQIVINIKRIKCTITQLVGIEYSSMHRFWWAAKGRQGLGFAELSVWLQRAKAQHPTH